MTVDLRSASTEVASFYDEFSHRHVGNFIRGNRREEAAIALAVRHLDRGTRSILDVGCGAGYSAYRFAQASNRVRVLGIDISEQNIRIANRLFHRPRVRFQVMDITRTLPADAYDLISLIDVFEHIPRNEWPVFSRQLGKCLTKTGRIVMTTPSEQHQQHLAEHEPDALQIIDETVALEDILQFAQRTETSLLSYHIASIFREHDYVHAVFCRNLRYRDLERPLAHKLIRLAARPMQWCRASGRKAWVARRLRDQSS